MKLKIKIIVTKEQAALNQIVTAIEMLLSSRYDCAITLAGAAEGLLPDTELSLRKKLLYSDPPPEVLSIPFGKTGGKYGELSIRDKNTAWNQQRDWLKHLNDDHEKTQEISYYDARIMITRAFSKLPEHVRKNLCDIEYERLRYFKELIDHEPDLF